MEKVRALDKLQRRAINNVPQEIASIYIPLNLGHGSRSAIYKKTRGLLYSELICHLQGPGL